jgi:SWIM zinc finger
MPKAKRRERSLRLVQSPRGHEAGVLTIREKDKTAFYVFREIACEIGGRAFAMHRLGLGTLYHVRVGGPSDCSCECLGFLAHGRCRHVLSLLALIDEGQI